MTLDNEIRTLVGAQEGELTLEAVERRITTLEDQGALLVASMEELRHVLGAAEGETTVAAARRVKAAAS